MKVAAHSAVHTQVGVDARRVNNSRREEVAEAGSLAQQEDRACPLEELARIGEESEETGNISRGESTHRRYEVRQVGRNIEGRAIRPPVATDRVQRFEGEIVF